MEAETLTTVAQAAGIGGIALAVLLTVFREVIQKNIFPQLDSASGYRLLRLLLILTWSIALIGVAAWLWSKRAEQPQPTRSGHYRTVGLITDQQENAIADASIALIGNGSSVRSDNTGAFTLIIPAEQETTEAILRITKTGFRPKTQKVTLPTTNLLIQLDKDPHAEPEPNPATAPPQPVTTRPPQPAIERGTVTLQYLGDAMGCLLNLEITLGDRTFAPKVNPYFANDVALNTSQYQITGNISCPSINGPLSCVAAGNGNLFLRSGYAYNVMWQNTAYGQCQVGLTPAG